MDLESINEFLAFYNELQKKKVKNEIKKTPESFLVEEITPSNVKLSYFSDDEIELLRSAMNLCLEKRRYLYAKVCKKKWETVSLAREIKRALGISRKRISYAGTKDRVAITSQLMSIENVSVEELLGVKIRDTRIVPVGYSEQKLRLGDLLGNRFEILLAKDLDYEAHEQFKSFLMMPNLFGGQRFGSRSNSHLVGKYIVKGLLREAVEEFLFGNPCEELEAFRQARERLRTELDYKNAKNYFPRALKHERAVIDYLAKNPRDYGNALRRLPRQLLLLFVHGYQSYLFNELMKQRLHGTFELYEGEYFCKERDNFPLIEEKAEKREGIPVGRVIGYETQLNDYEKELLEREGIKPEDFKVKRMPELSSNGNTRCLFVIPVDYCVNYQDRKIAFSLPKGSYATVFLDIFYDLSSR